MKTSKNVSAWIFGALLALCVFVGLAHGQDATPAPAANSDIVLDPTALNFILNGLGWLMVKYPVVATIIGIMGSMRFWAKPAFSALHALIDLTPSKFDDGVLAIVIRFFTENPLGKFFAYLIDWLTSIKIQPPAAKPTE